MKLCSRKARCNKLTLCAALWVVLTLWLIKHVLQAMKYEVSAPRRNSDVPVQRLTVNKANEIDRSMYFRGENVSDDILAIKPPLYLPNYKNPCWYETVETQHANTTTLLRCLPYFYLIGVDKCGTTDMWNRITQHPSVLRPIGVMNKETHWWSWKRFGFDIWETGRVPRHFDWYVEHFDEAAARIEAATTLQNNTLYHHLITGEGSPTTFWDFTGWDRIPQNKNRTAETAYLTPHCLHHLTPEAKLIVLFRDPTERLYSDYLFLDYFKTYHNVSARGFHQEVQKSIAMLTHCFSKMSKLECLYNRELHVKMPVRIIVGIYKVFLREWLKVFPMKQMLILKNEDYSNDIKSHLIRVFNFLQLGSLSDQELDRIVNLGRLHGKRSSMKQLGPMLAETRLLLNNFYSQIDSQIASDLNDSQ